MSFSVIKLGEVCSFVRGLTYSKSDEVDFSSNVVIRANNIDLNTHELNFNELRYIDESIVVKDDKKLKKNDILICTASGSKSHLGKVALVEEDLSMAFGGFMGVLRSDLSKISPQYLYRILISDIFKKHVDGLSNGANINNLKFSQIEKLEIPLPSIAIQQKIVKKLDAIFAEIDRATVATEANVKNAEALFQSYLTEVFEHGGLGWKKVKISEILKLEYGKALPDSDRDENGEFAAYGANGEKTRTNKFLFSKPSIIVGRKGSAGELTLVKEKFWALDVTYFVTHDDKNTDLYFLYYALITKNLTSYARGVKPGINRNDIYELEIQLPSLAIQHDIVTKIDAISVEVKNLNKSYSNKFHELANLKQSILKQAFSGELVKE